jgi:quercetin 2,3-dioxygenase
MNDPAELRRVARVITGRATSDGAGVNLTRVIGQPDLPMLDPFLMLDAFRSDDPQDYIAGFPPHPHRGFETVTYLLNGRMRHKDSAGHEGVIESGGVQWMTAARGIVHSEMPEQEDGLLEGFQLWINLPAEHKMDPPRYQELKQAELPQEQRGPGVTVRVIAGRTGLGSEGRVTQPLTDPLYLDVSLDAGCRFEEVLPATHNAFVYVVHGAVAMADSDGGEILLRRDQLAILQQGTRVEAAADEPSRLLLIAGRPLHEPVARGGPFVMNTQAEIRQAYQDYQEGRLG